MPDVDAIASLDTRSAVRGFLAKQLSDLLGGTAPQDLPPELAGLATDSDREVIETSRRLDKCYETGSAADPSAPHVAMGRKLRDLFAKALQRMKELPPDPRATLHVPVPAADAKPRRVRRSGP